MSGDSQRERLVRRYMERSGAESSLPSKNEVQKRLEACLGPPPCKHLVEGNGCYGCGKCSTCRSGQHRKILFTAPLSHFRCPIGRWPEGPLPVCRGGLPVYIMAAPGYRDAPTQQIRDAMETAGFSVETGGVARKRDQLADALRRAKAQPKAIIAWEEHGGVFCTSEWLRCLSMLYEADIMPMSVDYGYFDHYKTLILDRYQEDGTPTIRLDWDKIPDDRIHWEWAPRRLLAYRDKLAQVKMEALEAGPIEEPPYTLIWTQSGVTMARKPFRKNIRDKHAWLKSVCEAVRDAGERPVVKTTPLRMGPKAPDWVSVHDGKVPFKERRLLNARLALFAKDNIILTSSVSNELLLWEVPVTALGKSWFTGLGVFNEPESFGNLCDEYDIDVRARNKYANWWLKRQCYPNDIPRAFWEVYGEIVGSGDREFPYLDLYSRLYEKFRHRYRMLDDRFEEATNLLEKWVLRNGNVRSVIDIGCGWGEMVSWLIDVKGIDAHGIDIVNLPERSPANAFHVGDARNLPFSDGQFDVATSFDVMEHLTPRDVHKALAEAGRVANKVLFVVMKGDAGYELPGWPRLHQTIREDAWWRAEAHATGFRIVNETSTNRSYAALLEKRKGG